MIESSGEIDITPYWPKLFQSGEAFLQAADFDGKGFVLEMYQFGARCYDELHKND